mgnify:FL=1
MKISCANKSSLLITFFFIFCFLMNSGYCFVLQDDSITLISLALCTIISVFVFGLLKKQFFDIKFSD